MKNILVTIDFESNANSLTEMAAKLGKQFGAKLWLVHVAGPEPDFVGYETGPKYIRDLRAGDLRAEHRHIQKLAAEFEGKGIQADGLLIQGPTVKTILEKAAELNCDLILSGHHAHGFFYRTLVGSTSQELIQQSRVPVMLVPIA